MTKLLPKLKIVVGYANVWGKKSHRIISVMLLFVMCNLTTFAQTKTITGVVTSASDKTPIPGANIVVKGTTNGTITDIDGKYQITASSTDILIFSFIGYLNEEVAVGDQSTVSISLVEDIEQIDEVVVIGYGVQKKKLVTGATAQVNGDELTQRNSTNALQALQGQTAGVSITSTSGQPGEGMKVVIRGVGTTGDSSPLYIVDGVSTGSIDYLNASDIESIDVLKDAASAAIYGSRAANGVILVTTKKGKKGHSQITFDAYYGVQNLAKKVDMLNTDQYTMIMNEAHLNSGGTMQTLPFNKSDLPAYTTDGVANTDWLDEMFVENAVTQNYVFGAQGGGETGTYSMSLSYTGQEGIVGGAALSNYERVNGRFNSENSLYNDKIRIGQNFTMAHTQKNGVSVGNQYSNTLRGAFNVSPLMPVYDNEGNFFNSADKTILDQNGETYWLDTEANPYASMVINNQNMNKWQNFIGNVYAEIDLYTNLKFRTSIGIDYYSGNYRSYTPEYELSIYNFSNYSKVSQSANKSLKYMWTNTLNYDFTIGEHKFETMAGMAAESYNGESMYGSNAYLAFNDFDHAWLDNATNKDNAALMSIQGAPYDEDNLLSYFGRAQYNFRETYMFNATFRADGSSKFAPENQWGYFPSFSAGWVMTNEGFMAPITNIMQFFKLRASWGQNGSQRTSAFNYLAPIKFTQATYNFGNSEGVSTNGSYPSKLSNPDLSWETSEQTNIGFDARFIESKLSVNFDWFNKTTKDWLIQAPVLATAGTDAPYINGGNVTNSGVELALSYNDQIGDFSYTVGLNGTYLKNNVTDVPTSDGIIHGATNTLYANSSEFYRAESGHPMGYFWGYQTNGLFQTTAEVNSYTSSTGKIIQPKAKPGDVRYIDQNGDGVIDDSDKIELGDPNPNYVYGLNLSCKYKGFDFLFVANGAAGQQVVQSYRDHSGKYNSYTTEILERWTGKGTSNTIPRVTENNINYQFSDLFVKDAGYLRLSTITLGYDFTNIVKIKNLSQCRFYASAQNLYTFTKYSGMDPEVGYGLDNGDMDKFSSGIDLGYYPRPRTILFGVNLKF